MWVGRHSRARAAFSAAQHGRPLPRHLFRSSSGSRRSAISSTSASSCDSTSSPRRARDAAAHASNRSRSRSGSLEDDRGSSSTDCYGSRVLARLPVGQLPEFQRQVAATSWASCGRAVSLSTTSGLGYSPSTGRRGRCPEAISLKLRSWSDRQSSQHARSVAVSAAASAIVFPATRTASDSGLRRAPPHPGHVLASWYCRRKTRMYCL